MAISEVYFIYEGTYLPTPNDKCAFDSIFKFKEGNRILNFWTRYGFEEKIGK